MGRAFTSDGVEVATYDFGGTGSPLLLVHATGFHAHVLEPLAAQLHDRFHCYGLDVRGHGDSTRPRDGDFDWRGFAKDVETAVTALQLENPLAMGHSSGAAALLLAEAERPGTFSALYCYEPIVLPVELPPGRQVDNPLTAGARRRRETFASRDEAYASFASRGPFAVLHPDALRAYVDHGFIDAADGTVRLKCRRDDEAEVYAMMPAHDAFSRLPEIRCPVTLACGGQTDAMGANLLARLAERLPDARVEVLPGLGHFGPLQDPHGVAASVAPALTQ